MELTDVQWELLQPLVEPKTPRKRRGRPWRDTRQAGGGGRVMDFAHRSPMRGTAERQVSAVPDLPSPLPALGAGGHASPA